MKFLFLSALFAVTAVALECKATGFPTTGCDGCQWDIASKECRKTRDGNLFADCSAYINCQIEASQTAGSTVCPDTSNAARWCSKDVSGKNPVTGAAYFCGDWAKAGYCLPKGVTRPGGNAAWMVPHCKTSCCSACQFDKAGCPTHKDHCVNDYDKDGAKNCDAWMRRGECEKNPVWMNRFCAASCCEFCAPAPTPAPVVFQQPVFQQYYPQYPQTFSPFGNYAAASTPIYGAAATTAAPFYGTTAATTAVAAATAPLYGTRVAATAVAAGR